jgi:hypothetical protein
MARTSTALSAASGMKTRGKSPAKPTANKKVPATSAPRTSPAPTPVKAQWAGVIAPEHEQCRVERHTYRPFGVDKSGSWLKVTERCGVCGCAFRSYELNAKTLKIIPGNTYYEEGYVQIGAGRMPSATRERLVASRRLNALRNAGFIDTPEESTPSRTRSKALVSRKPASARKSTSGSEDSSISSRKSNVQPLFHAMG